MADTALSIGGGGRPPTNVRAANAFNSIAAVSIPIGSPVCQSPGVDFVSLLARANNRPTSQPTGFAIVPGVVGNRFLVLTKGILELEPDQWDQIIDVGGSLQRNSTYFLAAGPAAGLITTAEPSGGGDFITVMGRAISQTALQIRIGRAASV